MKKHYIISIRGVPGSGKTYICGKLNTTCIDTDKIVAKAYLELRDNDKFKKALALNKLEGDADISNSAAKMLFGHGRKLLKKALNDAPTYIVIVVGITLRIKSDELLFIEIPDTELPKIYRRATDNQKKIEAIVEKNDINEVFAELLFVHEVGALSIVSFALYKKKYLEAVKAERSRGAKIMTQKEIISYCEKIIKS